MTLRLIEFAGRTGQRCRARYVARSARPVRYFLSRHPPYAGRADLKVFQQTFLFCSQRTPMDEKIKLSRSLFYALAGDVKVARVGFNPDKLPAQPDAGSARRAAAHE